MLSLPIPVFRNLGLVVSAAALNFRKAKVSLRRKLKASDLLFQETLLFSLPLFIPFDLTLVMLFLAFCQAD